MAFVRVEQPLFEFNQFVRVHAAQAADILRGVEPTPAALGFGWWEIGSPSPIRWERVAGGRVIARFLVSGLNGRESCQSGINDRVIARALKREWEVLVQLLQHQSPGSAIRDAHL